MHLTRISLATLAVALLAGCSGAEQPEAVDADLEANRQETYENMYDLCKLMGLDQLAEQVSGAAGHRVREDPHEIVQVMYQPRVQAAAEAGCIDALAGEPATTYPK